MTNVVVVDAIRTAIGKNGGSLANTHPIDLLVPILQQLIERNGIASREVDEIITGCATMTGEQGLNIGKIAALAAGIPTKVPTYSINRLCGSSHQAIHAASQAIIANDADVVIACGVENGSRVPIGSDMGELSDSFISKYNDIPQCISAEKIALIWNITRKELDEYSLLSHQRAVEAIEEGYFEREIIPIEINVNNQNKIFMVDEGVKGDLTIDKLMALPTSFIQKDAVITEGNSSQFGDGAAGLLIMSEQKAKQLSLKPRAKIIARKVVGTDSTMMISSIISVTKAALKKACIPIEKMDVIEVNEDFASIIKVFEKEMQPSMNRVNVRGGAIALGHLLGASGARIATTLLHTLEDHHGKYGLQVMGNGFGMATATIYERVSS